MCRNIHTLFNYEPSATDEEVQDAAIQYVRKISGFTKPSQANEEAFARAVDEIAASTRRLVDSLVTTAAPKDREVEAERRKARAAERFAAAYLVTPGFVDAYDCSQPTLTSIAPTSRTARAISRPISRIASVSRAVDGFDRSSTRSASKRSIST